MYLVCVFLCQWTLLSYRFWSVFCIVCVILVFFFFFKQKTAYEMRISDWSSDVCSSDLFDRRFGAADGQRGDLETLHLDRAFGRQFGHFGANAQADPPVRQNGGRIGEADAIFAIFDRRAREIAGDRDREFAARQEFGGFARNRGQIGLRQRRDQTRSFADIERGDQVESEQAARSGEAARAGGRVDRIGGVAVGIGRDRARLTATENPAKEAIAKRTVGVAGQEVAADFLDQRPVNFGDANQIG